MQRLLTICLSIASLITLSAQDAFITTWQTTTSNEPITITVSGDIGGAIVKYDIDWGDGQMDVDVRN